MKIRNSLQLASAFAAGLLFAGGLCLSGMTNPAKILGFLDLFGRWDPTLVFVMMGAVATHAVLYRLVTRRAAPLFAERFAIPSRKTVDAPLVVGSALFGIGWGLAGYCPGPAVTSLASGRGSALIFVGGMVIGLGLYSLFDRAGTRRSSSSMTATAGGAR
jgi:uncharacterized membrane protein YedE/YeeE